MNSNRLLFTFLLLSASSCNKKITDAQRPLPDQFVNVRIDQQVSGQMGPCEPSLFINPLNKDEIVAGAILDKVYTSQDGGKSWTKGRLESPYGVWGDPVITADYNGTFYYSHLSDPSGRNWASKEILDRIVVQKSINGGKDWNDGSYAGFHHPKDQDKQWMTVNPSNNHLFMTWTEFDRYGSSIEKDKSRILFAKSVDGGESWSDAIAINQFDGNCLDDDQTTEGAVPVIGPNGEIFVAWAYNEKIYFDRSLDAGKTWLKEDIVVSDQPAGWTIDIPGLNRSNGLPVTAVDQSDGPHRGTIYVNWADQRNGPDDTDIWLSRSTDSGMTWSTPQRINDDPPGKHNFLSWISVDAKTGHIYIVFYDRRAYNNLQTDVYLAFSVDGGNSFTNRKISDSPFSPSATAFFGDYTNIHAYDNRVRPIWTRYEDGLLSVWTALIDL